MPISPPPTLGDGSAFESRNNCVNRRISSSLANSTLALAVALGLAGAGQAQESKTIYPSMAPLDQYLMSESAEIALARSAAPPSISGDATIAVLKPHGYETAVNGKNGFVCLVERSWMSQFDALEFWNPKMRGVVCFNAAAARTVMPFTYKRTEMILAGMSKEKIAERLKQIAANREVPALEPGAMCYMMSKDMYLGDKITHWHSHLMFYGPRSDNGDMGNDLPGSPVLLNPQFQNHAPEPLATYMVLVDHWSDGTPAPKHGQ
jgi:hypothetical protein